MLYLKHIDYPDFEATTNTGLSLVEFWADWCPPCKVLESILETLAARNHENIKFFKVNADENRVLTNMFRIGTIPTILFIRDGKIIDRLTGLQSLELIESKLNLLYQTSIIQ